MSRIKADSGMQEPHDRDPRDLDKGMFDERPLAVEPGAANWQKSPAGQAYLRGENGMTIMTGPTTRVC